MKFRITETNIRDQSNITLNVSHNGTSWTGISWMSIDDLRKLRKTIRKFINTKKKTK